MKLSSSARVTAAVVITAVLTSGAVAPALAQSVSVTLNGTPLNLDPAPQTRAGRVFVPLRGIFESLGASVVYANGTINAQQGRDRSVSLHIGSTDATVNGQPQALDVAPFIIGASTYVPLRFVSQALGAIVNYDAANHLVALNRGGGGGGGGQMQPPPQGPPPAPAGSPVRLRDVRPGRDATVSSRRPSIEGQFGGGQADPNTLRISLDELDITDQTSRSPVGFVFSPQSDLQSMQHTVRVVGRDTNGGRIDQAWRFTSGTSTVQVGIERLAPADGETVGPQFTVRGRTLPGAQVVVQVGAVERDRDSLQGAVGQILGLGGGANVRNEVIANDDGSFSTVIQINAPPGARLEMVVNASDPRTKTAAQPISRRLIVGQ